jgi:predicted HTH transcriptional regulator
MTMISVAQVDLWRVGPSEHHNLEFKEAKLTFDLDKAASYCVAIANEGGGHLVLGIADKVPRAVVNTNAFRNTVESADKLFVKLGFRVDIEEIAHPDGRVVVLIIPSRPRGIAYHHDGKYLMRSGANLVPMSEDRLRTIFAEGKPDWLEEPSINGASSQVVVDLLDTQTFFELLKQPYPTNQDAVLEKLINDKLVDKTPNGYSIRRICALLLAKNLDLFPELEKKAPRVIVYNGPSKLDTKIDEIHRTGYAVGFRNLHSFIMSQMPQNEIIENALRKRVKLLPDVSMRELIANALIHQDFMTPGMAPTVEIYSNRVEISNPGEPVVPTQRFIDGYQSRNERLANFMRRMDVCEEKGSGIDRVVDEAEFFQLPAPDFKAMLGRTIVIVYGPKPFDEMDREDRMRACYQHCSLKYVMSQAMTNQSLRDRFRLPESKAAITSQIISATMDAKLIKADSTMGGSRKYARYLPIWA